MGRGGTRPYQMLSFSQTPVVKVLVQKGPGAFTGFRGKRVASFEGIEFEVVRPVFPFINRFQILVDPFYIANVGKNAVLERDGKKQPARRDSRKEMMKIHR